MTMHFHPSVLAVREAAGAVLAHPDSAHKSVWRRWFEASEERHLLDDVKAFVLALGDVQDVPPHLLTPADLKDVGEQIERVIARIETSLDHSAREAGPLTSAVYVIRARYEDLYRRGATG